MVQRFQGKQQWREPNQNGEVLHRITRTEIAVRVRDLARSPPRKKVRSWPLAVRVSLALAGLATAIKNLAFMVDHDRTLSF